MDRMQNHDPFQVVKNYRKMIKRRDRYHKKRKPKLYPPTNIKTRSMESREKPTPSQFPEEWDPFLEVAQNSQSWIESGTPQLYLLQENSKGFGQYMPLQCLVQENIQKVMDEKDILDYWNNQVDDDLSEEQLLCTH